MSLKDLLALADDKLHEVFATKPHDPAKARAPIVKGIDRTSTQFASATPVKGKKWFRIANGIVELNLPFAVGGKTTHYVPSERFSDFLDKLKALVNSGDLDDDIKAGAGEGRPATTRKPRAASFGEGSGWSEERRARFAESIAKRKAAQGGSK